VHVEADPAVRNGPHKIVCSDGSRPRVLLAEDSGAARILTAALLGRMGCDVDAVEDGEEALACARSNHYDVIVLDIEMPVMDGVVAAREIRALGGPKARTPIVAFSAFLADFSATGSIRSVFDETLSKPAGRNAIRRTLERALKDRATAPAMTMDHGASAGSATSLGLVDVDALRSFRTELAQKMWANFVAAAIGEVRDSLAGAEMALSNGDRDALRRHCHKIKGFARTFAALQMAAMAERLEGRLLAEATVDCAADFAGLKSCVAHTVSALGAMGTA
jgi:CheY-like chemotaxis protein/HPt (histidine-containing phosphotransfer) domain-containing protein